MDISYNRSKDDLIKVMKSKAEKKNMYVFNEGNKLQVGLQAGKFKGGEDAIPVIMKGKIIDSENECVFKGKFSYGFYLYTLVIAAAVLIVARFSWSAYQKQIDNMILCGIVTALLGLVIIVVLMKSKKAKKIILDFMTDLNLK